MSALTCGVDIGSTNVKVILVDERARAVWTKAVPTPRVPDEGGVATDVLRLVAMIEEMIIEGLVDAWPILAPSKQSLS
jgi:xylulokinase